MKGETIAAANIHVVVRMDKGNMWLSFKPPMPT